MRNALLDELIADHAGVTAAVGTFRDDWFLHFMGLESPDGYRDGGRLENYRGTPPLGEGAFRVLQRVVRLAAHRLAAFDASGGWGPAAADPLVERASRIRALARLTLEELAADDAHDRLAAARGGTA